MASIADYAEADPLRNALYCHWQSARIMRFSKDEAVYTSGQRDDRIYLIEEGRVEIVAYSNNGKRCILSVQVEGEVFGELGTMARSRLATARAMGSTVLRVIPAARLQAALDETGLAKDFALHLLKRLHHATARERAAH